MSEINEITLNNKFVTKEGLANYDSKLPPIKRGAGELSFIFNEGDAQGESSIAGGSTDLSLIAAILGNGYADFIANYGDQLSSTNPITVKIIDDLIQTILDTTKSNFTIADVRRMLTLTKAHAQGDVAIALGANIKAQSALSLVLGYENISGAKGYYMTDARYSEGIGGNTIWLEGRHYETISNNWKENDKLLVISGGDSYLFTYISVSDENSSTPILVQEDIPFEYKNKNSFSKPNENAVINLNRPDMGVETFGWGATSIGALNKALGSGSFSHGYKNLAYGDFSVAFGQENEAGYSAFATGIGNKAQGKAAFAEGNGNVASGENAHVEGTNNTASGTNAHAEGNDTKATETNAHAEGNHTTASGKHSHAEGANTQALSSISHAEGWGSIANNVAAHAEGYETYVDGENAHAEGYKAKAIGYCSHAEGAETQAIGDGSHAAGKKTTAFGIQSYAEGRSSNISTDQIALAVDMNTNSLRTKWKTTPFALAFGEASHIEGRNGLAIGRSAHAEGVLNEAVGDNAHAEGNLTQAIGNNSHTEGYKTEANNAAHAEGNETHALGAHSHAEGSATFADGISSHAEGWNTHATKEGAHAEGWQTWAEGDASHAEGQETHAIGQASHAGGKECQALGEYSFAHGLGLKTNAQGQTVIGSYNKEKSDCLFIIGGGSSSYPSNIFEVRNSGWPVAVRSDFIKNTSSSSGYFDCRTGILFVQGKCNETPVQGWCVISTTKDSYTIGSFSLEYNSSSLGWVLTNGKSGSYREQYNASTSADYFVLEFT